MKSILAALLMFIALAAYPKCITNDKWMGADKTKHLAVGAGIGAMSMLIFNDPEYAFFAGAAIGVAKEVYDSRGKGTCSLQDAAVTAIGAAGGAYGVWWILSPNYVGVSINF
jgi:uncharacterized protein YfiM (DUF2279 family)